MKKPTRGDHLLDLVLSDLDEAISTEVLSKVADHQLVRTTVNMKMPLMNMAQREVWIWKKARWHDILVELRNANWDWIDFLHPDQAAEQFTEFLVEVIRRNVPSTFLNRTLF